MDSVKKTEKTYGLLWRTPAPKTPRARWHFSDMQALIPEAIVRGSKGIEIGCGCGYDTCLMAKDNPGVDIASIDISDGVYEAKRLTAPLRNVYIARGSALEIPFKENTFDFAYSFGVLHHTPSPRAALREIRRVIKKDSPVFLYLYENHEDARLKYYAVKMTTLIRKITTKIPAKILYLLCVLASPCVVILFSYPARIAGKFAATKALAQKIPFNFGTHPFSVAGDLYDRFSAPIEFRFGRRELRAFFEDNGFADVRIEKFSDKAGWVAWGYKKDEAL